MLPRKQAGQRRSMDSTSAQRIGAGLSLLFAPGARAGLANLRSALETCQMQVQLVRADEGSGTAELVASGLTFEVDGLAPGIGEPAGLPRDSYGFADVPRSEAVEAVRLFPGHALSGGLSQMPVVRALLALAAELVVGLPVQAVYWHPADTAIEPRLFSRSVLAWLAGGTFPAQGLTALSALADGSVVSRGLAHFVGQEMTLRAASAPDALKLAAHVVDQIVRTGPLQAYAEWRLQDVVLCAEPAREARQILVWPAG
jgi:hypothetical protein